MQKVFAYLICYKGQMHSIDCIEDSSMHHC